MALKSTKLVFTSLHSKNAHATNIDRKKCSEQEIYGFDAVNFFSLHFLQSGDGGNIKVLIGNPHFLLQFWIDY